MKKTLGILMALLLLFPNITNGQEDDEWSKAVKKEYKTKLKDFKKQGWKVFGSSRTIEVLLHTHLDWLNYHPNVYEIVGVANGFKSMNLGRQMAMNNAYVTYASQMSSVIKGRAISDMKADASNQNSEFDQFFAVFERYVEKEIRGEIKESFSLIREKGNGVYEMQSFFLVNEEAASDARRRALKYAAQETMTAQKYADIVSKYINEKIYPHQFYADDAQKDL